MVPAPWTAGNRGCRAVPVAAVCPITVKPRTVSKTWYIRVYTSGTRSFVLKTGYYSSLLLENTHAMTLRPRSQTDRRKRRRERKQGEKKTAVHKVLLF